VRPPSARASHLDLVAELLLLFDLLPDDIHVPVLPRTLAQLDRAIADVFPVHFAHGANEVGRVFEADKSVPEGGGAKRKVNSAQGTVYPKESFHSKESDTKDPTQYTFRLLSKRHQLLFVVVIDGCLLDRPSHKPVL